MNHIITVILIMARIIAILMIDKQQPIHLVATYNCSYACPFTLSLLFASVAHIYLMQIEFCLSWQLLWGPIAIISSFSFT